VLVEPSLADLTLHSHSLELGAGSGLVGLAVASACGPQGKLLLTDQLEMLELMQHNIVLNNLQDRATALILNW
jgi:tRNA1(Val) A37 N6-methylase TrmN6